MATYKLSKVSKEDIIEKLEPVTPFPKAKSVDGIHYPPPRHKCLLAKVKTGEKVTSGADVCRPERPSELLYEKIKLHYVVHYLQRGSFEKLVPELLKEQREKTEYYQCNLCKKKFKNNLGRKEYPARGSFICHIATEHGVLLKLMEAEENVDMTPVIQLLASHDESFRNFLINGCPELDESCAEVKESPLFRLRNQNFNNDSAPNSNEKRKVLMDCPKCPDFKKKDAAALRLHMYPHYLEHWEKKLEKEVTDLSEDIWCERCKKKICGPTEKGRKGALFCHWAVSHQELKELLYQDPDVEPEFSDAIFGVVDKQRQTENKSRNEKSSSETSSNEYVAKEKSSNEKSEQEKNSKEKSASGPNEKQSKEKFTSRQKEKSSQEQSTLKQNEDSSQEKSATKENELSSLEKSSSKQSVKSSKAKSRADKKSSTEKALKKQEMRPIKRKSKAKDINQDILDVNENTQEENGDEEHSSGKKKPKDMEVEKLEYNDDLVKSFQWIQNVISSGKRPHISGKQVSRKR